jgi:hypothetical protein
MASNLVYSCRAMYLVVAVSLADVPDGRAIILESGHTRIENVVSRSAQCNA